MGSTMYIAWDHINTNCILIFSVCFACLMFPIVLILRNPAYLGINGDKFFQTQEFFWRSFYVQIGILQFVLRVQINAKLYVTNLYLTNLY
jgi:hypothetical protein